MANSNVLYYEPNWTHSIMSDNGGEKLVELAPSLEDYCIVLDLEVEVPSRPIEGKVKSDSSTILLRYASKKGGQSAVSFMQGKKGINDTYLSTDAMEYGTFNDIEQISGTTTNEMFGINSVNIEYNNYQVPVVTIEFTDIRGLSLFAVEEFRHDQITNGLPYTQNSDLTGSFFKSFFTFPHPKFKLTVKGFYGQPVAYDLYCSDFRANFNANSGNFGATAKFIGYSFSIMNDLTLTSLLASPYSEYYGESYWNSKIEDKIFILDNGQPMPRLPELIKNVKDINNNLNKVRENDDLKKLQEELNIINSVIEKCTIYSNALFNKITSEHKFNFATQDGNKLVVSGDYTSDSNYRISEDRECRNAYDEAKNAVKQYDETLLSLLSSYAETQKNNVFAEQQATDNLSYNYTELTEAQINGIKKHKYVYEFNWVDLFNKLNTASQNKSKAITAKEKDIANQEKATIYSTLGFHPTVENITNIILAHVDTFLHELYTCADSVKSHIDTNRTVNSFRTEKDVMTYGKESDIMYAFPEVVQETYKDDVTKLEKTWIGVKDSEAPEAKLIESLLKATEKIRRINDEVSEALNESTSNDTTTTTKTLCNGVSFPIATFDLLGNSAPYSGVNVNDITDFIGNIFLRVASLSMVVNDKNVSYEHIGKVDALNFYHNIAETELTSEFSTLISEGGTYAKLLVESNLNKLLKGFTVKHQEFGINTPIWVNNRYKDNGLYHESQNGQKHCVKTPNTYFYNTTKACHIYPLCGIEWDKFDPSTSDNNSESVISDKYNPNWFKLENNWKIYDEYATQRQTSNYSDVDAITNCAFSPKDFASYYKRMLKKGEITTKPLEGQNKGQHIDDLTSEIEASRHGNPNFIIDSFNGYYKGDISIKASLFGQKEFYDTPLEGQALLFLNSFNWDLRDFMSNFKDNNYSYMPYYFVLTIGGYLYRHANGHDKMFGTNSFKSLNTKQHELIDNRGLLAYQDNLQDSLFALNKDIKEELITEFKSWVNGGFKEIMKTFALSKEIIDKLDGVKDSKDLFSVLAKDSTTSPYISVMKHKNGNYKLRNASSSIESVVKEFIKPLLVIRGTDYYDTDDVPQIEESNLYLYAKGFIEGLRELSPIDATSTTSGAAIATNDVDAFKTIKEIKISLYYYLKRIWDKWLSGSGVEHDGKIVWEYSKFKERWHYIDTYFNKVGDSASINVIDFTKDVINAYVVAGYSALSLISTTYGKSGFNLISTQSFLSMVTDEKMKDIFKPIPYKEIDFSDISSVPDFVVMHVYEPSSKLASIDDSSLGDSYMIGGDELQLPEAIKTKNIKSGYKIPAFGVTVGKQYQSYFSDVSVSMENPQVTEQSLNAQFQIAEMAQGGQEWTVVGSDLFTIYSNNSYTCTVTMMGCAWIQPLMNFQLNNVPMFKGTYLIQKVSHNISQGQMTTTFVGTRMANVASPIIKDGLIVNGNSQNGGQAFKIASDQGKKASIHNDCKYNYYNPLLDASGVGMPKEELYMSMYDYGQKYGGWKMTDEYCPSESWQKNHTVQDFLGCVIIGEAGIMDDLGKKQVAAVIFNRYKAKGDLIQVFRNNVQHETRKWSKYQDKDVPKEYKDIVEEIFLQTPIVLVGTDAIVKHSVPIWNYMENTGKMSQSTTLNEHMVKSMTAYDTTMGYDTNYKNPRSKYNVDENGKTKEKLGPIPPSKGSKTWHGGEYLFQHDYREGKNRATGHVFVSTTMNSSVKAGQELWQVTDTKNDSQDNKTETQYRDRLFESIKKTCNDSVNIKIENLEMKESRKKDDGTMEITCTPSSGMAQVFDVVLNAYYDNIDELYWVVKDSGSEYPEYLQVTVNKGATNKKIAIAKQDAKSKNGVEVLNQHEGLNELFYLCLQKHYGKLTKDNNALFTLECLNFVSLITSKGTENTSHWTDTVNGYFNATLTACEPQNATNNLSDTDIDDENSIFTWRGTDSPANKLAPTQLDSSALNMDKMYSALKKGVKDGNRGGCAKYVRLALAAGGFHVAGYQPLSACRYVAHLPYWGFHVVYEGVVGGDHSQYKPQNGDISVIAGKTNGEEKEKHGHIQVYYEGGWYSDFKARTMYCYGSPQGRPFKIFRQNKA